MYLIERVNLYVKRIGERLVAKCNMCVGVVFVTILVTDAVVTNTQASTIDVGSFDRSNSFCGRLEYCCELIISLPSGFNLIYYLPPVVSGTLRHAVDEELAFRQVRSRGKIVRNFALFQVVGVERASA